MASPKISPIPTLLRPPSYHPVVDWMPQDSNQPHYYVINPMHVITLRDRSRTFAVRCVEKIKAISEKWFTHILLLIFLVGYASLGAVIFRLLEMPREKQGVMNIERIKEDISTRLWNIHIRNDSTKEEWDNNVAYSLKIYKEQLDEYFINKMETEQEKWGFWESMFYCCTVFTTIGYGNTTPKTTAGQAVTIVYAFIGIPFLLMVLADFGKLFTRTIKYVFHYIRKCCHTHKMRKMRRAGRRATAIPAQYMNIAWNYMPNQSRLKSKQKSTKDQNEDVESPNEKEAEANSEVLSTPEILTPNYYDVDDEFNLPVSLALLILLAYMLLGAFLFTLWEDWTLFEAFYFVFVSMSTIGFGDFVPDHPKYMMATFIYLLFGLALTSMCINIVQEKLSATFQKARLRLGTTFGLDVANMMEEENNGKSDIAEVHGKNKSRRGSKAETPPKNEKEVVANGSADTKDNTTEENRRNQSS